MPLKSEVLDRLLLSKSFLEKIRFQPISVSDRHTVAMSVIAAHDAAELAIAGVCDQLGCLPPNDKAFLMDYFGSFKNAKQTEMQGREYFRNLNSARNLLKHQGIFPDARQWGRAGEIVFQYITAWCSDYLAESFADLDDSALLLNAEVKRLYDEAKKSTDEGTYKITFEKLALALSTVFEENSALRGFEAGNPNSSDAIRVVGFGIHGNDFLTLQEFLPHVSRWGSDSNIPKWKQSKNGHPGNWTKNNAMFCLRTFVDIAVKLQGAQWVPRALPRSAIYDQQIEALKDAVEFWRDVPDTPFGVTADVYSMLGGKTKRETKQLLAHKGDRLRASVSQSKKDGVGSILGSASNEDVLTVMLMDSFASWNVRASHVRVTCVPIESDTIKEYFAGLPEIDWEPE